MYYFAMGQHGVFSKTLHWEQIELAPRVKDRMSGPERAKGLIFDFYLPCEEESSFQMNNAL